MAGKYRQIDRKLLMWLDHNRVGVTTAKVFDALKIQDETTRRHISRRFTQLEDKGNLVCSLQGTTRICAVSGVLPASMSKHKKWTFGAQNKPQQPGKAIPGTTSDDFIQAGGEIEKLPSCFDKIGKGSQPLGPHILADMLELIE
jgi:hypothetical protein